MTLRNIVRYEARQYDRSSFWRSTFRSSTHSLKTTIGGGKGFTEWTNISRGVPRFKGHYQPRIPRDLGFYSLTDEETFRSQIRMALAGGVHGFVFYYYWFDGKRLMEQPVERFLADPDAEMPFCLMWANENWTRRWDGEESEVLITQNYRVVDDVKMTADFARHFADPRYIRLQGRPLLMIYRPALSRMPRPRWHTGAACSRNSMAKTRSS